VTENPVFNSLAVAILAVTLASCTTMQLRQDCTSLQEKKLDTMVPRAQALLAESRRNLKVMEADKAEKSCAENLYSIVVQAEQCNPLRDKSKLLAQNIIELEGFLEEAAAVRSNKPVMGKYIRLCEVQKSLLSPELLAQLEKPLRSVAHNRASAKPSQARVSSVGKPSKSQSVRRSGQPDYDSRPSQSVETDHGSFGAKPVTPEDVERDYPDAFVGPEAPSTAPVQLRPSLPPVENQKGERAMDGGEDVRIVGPSFFPDEAPSKRPAR